METKLDNEQLRMMNIINRSSLQLLSFINDLLDFSHISDGKINFNIKEFNLEDCLKSSIELFQLEIEEKKINLEMKYDLKLPKKIIHDRQRIQQIIVNIISNAVKFSDINSKINIELLLDKIISDNELMINLKIVDNGCGISEPDLEKLKKFLNRQDVMYFTNNFGLGYGYINGLGLPISKFLINKMNGYFDIQSSTNVDDNQNGTSISIKIPVKYNEFQEQVYTVNKLGNNQVLIISNNVEKRINIVENVIKNGLLPIPVNTIEEGNIYINNENTNLCMVILLIDTLSDLIKTFGFEDKKEIGGGNISVGDYKYIIYKLINNYKKNNCHTKLFLFYNPAINYDLGIFNMFINKYDINLLNTKNDNSILPKLFKQQSFKSNNNHNNHTNLFKNLKILSVEDNFANQTVINKMLNNLGIQNITNLYDGIKFIEELEKANDYDIIFIDLKMPRLNGIEAVKEIQAKSLKNKSFFVAITATVTEETIIECFKIGMDAFIPKPIQVNDLNNIIDIITTTIENRK
jgi:CheY-like chemotaxis protein